VGQKRRKKGQNQRRAYKRKEILITLQQWYLSLSNSPYRVGSIRCNDRIEVTVGIIQLRELGWVHGSCLSNETDATVRQRLVVGRRQAAQFVDLLVQRLTDRTVGAIGSDQDIAMILCTICASDHHAVIALFEREDAFAHVQLFRGNLAHQQIVQHRSSNDEAVETTTMGNEKHKGYEHFVLGGLTINGTRSIDVQTLHLCSAFKVHDELLLPVFVVDIDPW